jgi:oligoribonuclease NrnB/cAMP/cGMP phosphodiesterase (DHH superfamily)
MSPTRRPVILYHSNCADGFTAAWAAWLHFGDAAKYVPCHYGQPVYELEEDDGDVYLVDFSYKMAGMEALYARVLARGCRLVVLDHHETALKELGGWLDMGVAGEMTLTARNAESSVTTGVRLSPGAADTGEGSLYINFDMEECGATLAWDFWHAEEARARPNLLTYIKERDLGYFTGAKGPRFDYVDQVAAAVETMEKDFKIWSYLAARVFNNLDEVLARGDGALALKNAIVKKAAEHAIPITLGYDEAKGFAVNASAFFSEIAGELAKLEGAQFGAVYFQRTDLVWQFSLRSQSGFKVNDLAVQYGGGGHPEAAGFEIDNLRKIQGLHRD